MVSIHASVKDATPKKWFIGLSDIVSIHASVKDATKTGVIRPKSVVFQSTHL